MKNLKNNLWRYESVHAKLKDGILLDTHKRSEIQKITFTEQETKIISFLKSVNETIEKNRPTLRIAGGWVRDKLLGKSSKDMDICLDTMTGQDFAKIIVDFQEKNNLKKRNIGIIKQNPDQAKHLETATTYLFDQPIDIVHTRSEVYSDDSRIPKVQFGTPKEDALRRDFTVNSLFYNIDKDEVEDLTEKGVQDLKDGIIRTPLDPSQTFLDDPLRLIRCVRFACNFNFLVHPELFEVVKDQKVMDSLLKKVSRERVGIEVQKIMEGSDPIGGVALLQELGVKDAIFCIPKQEESFKNQFKDPIIIKWKDFDDRIKKMRDLYHLEENNRKIVLFACLLYDVDDINGFIVHSLKLPIKLSQEVTDLISYSKSFDKCKSFIEYGHWIRGIKDLWETCLKLNSVIYEKNDLKSIEFLKEHKFDKMIHMKPLLNGTEICNLLNVKPSKRVGDVTNKIIEYQIENFEKITKKDLEEIILKNKW